MAASTDAQYNSASRSIECKIDIYLNGNDQAPLTASINDILVDMSLLDEAGSDNETPFGNVTANELTFTLFNSNGQFTPTNTQSPYYGKMKKGVMCKSYFRPAGYDWDQLGTFYISDWRATITGTVASITANDVLYKALNDTEIDVPVQHNETISSFYQRIFAALGIAVTVDGTLTDELSIAYATGSNSSLLTKLSEGAMALCCCNHLGSVVVRSLIASQAVRATLTDADQIMSAGAEFSIKTGYDSAALTYYIPQESAATEMLKLDSFEVPTGANTSVTMGLSIEPLVRVLYASLVGSLSATITDLVATSKTARFTTNNTMGNAGDMSLTLNGTTVENTAFTIGSPGSNALSIDNIFVQSGPYANRVLQVLNRYVDSSMPTITIEARGNPLLNIGDKIVVHSTKYSLNFTGILVRQQFTYNGAMSSTLTLLDAALLEV